MTAIKIDKELRHTYGANGVQVAWQWCQDNFGPSEPEGIRWHWNMDCTFYFLHEQDALLFALRWSDHLKN